MEGAAHEVSCLAGQHQSTSSGGALLTELFAYDPADIEPEYREKMAGILKARAELFSLSSEVTGLRARAWAGEEGLTDLIDLKAADLAKLREDYGKQMIALFKVSVDVEGLLGLLPMLGLAVLNKFKVPPLLLLEAAGMDVDNLKLIAQQLKELVEENR